MSNWQPMNTAPRDGTGVLVALRNHGIDLAFWGPSSRRWLLVHDDDDTQTFKESMALGWMPLPVMPDAKVLNSSSTQAPV